MAPSIVRYDPGNRDGFWGDITASIDWCETNYEVTYYIAEFWNSVSNLAFIIPPLILAFKLRKDLEMIYLMSLLYMAFTGCGSFAFHATLKLSGQLWDELSMVWSGLFILYLILRIKYPKTNHFKFAAALTLYGIFTNFVYLGTNFWTLFEVSYAIIHLSVVTFAWNLHPDADKRLYWATVIMSTTGFGLWNIDNHLCESLQRARSLIISFSGVASPCLVPITQFHALWHCLAGYGAFCLVVYCIQARLMFTHGRKSYDVSLDFASGIGLKKTNEWQVGNKDYSRRGIKNSLYDNNNHHQDFLNHKKLTLEEEEEKNNRDNTSSFGATRCETNSTSHEKTSSQRSTRETMSQVKHLRKETTTTSESEQRQESSSTTHFLLHDEEEGGEGGGPLLSTSKFTGYTQLLKEHDQDRKRD